MIQSFTRDIWLKASKSPKVLFPFYKFVPNLDRYYEALKNEGLDDAQREEVRLECLRVHHEFRDDLIRIAESDPGEMGMILKACERDFLFFVNAFGWLKQEQPYPADVPFITWQKQNKLAAVIMHMRRRVVSDPMKIARGDLWLNKSREVGASWEICVYETLHIIRFLKDATCLSGSRRAEDVDKPGASKSTFWKIEYAIDHLPLWMIPEGYYTDPVKRKVNQKHNSEMKIHFPGWGTLLGETTQENFGAQGRFFKVDLDEFAHTDDGQPGMGEMIWVRCQATTKMRRAVSTPNGEGNKFATLRHVPPNPDFYKMELDWWDDPVKGRNKEWRVDGLPWSPCWWSPWAEAERRAMDNDSLFGQEYMKSFAGVGGSYYGDERLAVVRDKQVRNPVAMVHVDVPKEGRTPRIATLVDHPNGFFKLWEVVGPAGPFPGNFVMGVDIAAGSKDEGGKGASNSVIAVGRWTGKVLSKVGEYRCHALLAHKFARIAVAVGYLFKSPNGVPAFMVPETNGPGDAFIQTAITDYDYPNMFYRVNKTGGGGPGFHNMQRKSKISGQMEGSRKMLFETHKKWLNDGWYEEPSIDTLLDMEQYKTTPEGGAEHVRSKSSLDPNDSRENHGDCCVATALMIWGALYLGTQPDIVPATHTPHLSVAWARAKKKSDEMAVFH